MVTAHGRWWERLPRTEWEDHKRWNTTAANAAKVRSPNGLIVSAVHRATGQSIRSAVRRDVALFNDIIMVTTDRGDEIVIRIRKDEPGHFMAEAWALPVANAAGLPVPEVLVAFDEEIDGVLWAVSVEKKMPGECLEALLAACPKPDEELCAVVRQLGSMMAQLHAIKPPGLGDIGPDATAPHATWGEHLTLEPPPTLGDVCRISRTDIDDVLRAARLLDEAHDEWEGVTPSLLHGDFVSDQVLVEAGHVSAILDFEHPKGGDAAWEFAYWSFNNRHPWTIDAMAEGYNDGRGFSPEMRRRIRLNRLQLGLSWIYRATRGLEGVWGAFILQRFYEDLDALSA